MWEKEGSELPLKTQESALVFPFLNKSDSGIYGCTAISNMGRFKAYYTLNVNGEPAFSPAPLPSLSMPSPRAPPDGAQAWTRGQQSPFRAFGLQTHPGTCRRAPIRLCPVMGTLVALPSEPGPHLAAGMTSDPGPRGPSPLGWVREAALCGRSQSRFCCHRHGTHLLPPSPASWQEVDLRLLRAEKQSPPFLRHVCSRRAR